MAALIGGRKVSTGIASKYVTIPLAGMWLAKTKAGSAYTLYIDFFTNAGKVHRGYKSFGIATRDPSSPFMALCKAFKVNLPPAVTQRAAAEMLAAAMAEYGALKCVRSGKKHDWTDITPVNLDIEVLPWGFKAIDGMKMESLWHKAEYTEDTQPEEDEPQFSIVGKTIEDLRADLEAGVPLWQVEQALSVDILDGDIDLTCHTALSSLHTQAVAAGKDIVRIKRKVQHVQA